MIKYTELASCSFLVDDNHFIYDVEETVETIHLFIKSKCHSCTCPSCGASCRKLHSTYIRTIQDTPLHGKQTLLHVDAYKYYCLNSECFYHVFSESLPFVRPSQVRTETLNTLILGVAIFLSNECASKILALLGVSVSNDTIQRLYDRLEFIDDPEIEAVGIDDIAIRKGQTYATAIYDFNDHHLIALLDGRDAKTLKKWLIHHPKINLVTRDRANAYAKAITEVLPDCVQVADRFHLLQNLLARLKDIFKSELPEDFFIRNGTLLDQAPEKIYIEKSPDKAYLEALHYDNSVPRNPDGSEKKFDNKRRNLNSTQYLERAKNRKAKQAVIREIQAEWAQTKKKDVHVCAQKFHIHPNTLKKYLKMTDEEITQMDQPKDYKKRKTVMDNYLNMIFKMMQDGFSDETIYFYLRDQGCDKNYNTIWTYLEDISKNNFPNRTTIRRSQLLESHYPQDVKKITRTQLLKYLLTVNPNTKKDEQLAAVLPLLEEKYPLISEVETIFKTFHTLLMGASPEALDEFIETYQNSIIAPFCQTIKKDIAPVKNAISLKASSGFVEGNNNKFKLIKRIVYGRSGLVNLSKKCQLAFSATVDGFSLQDLL